MSIGSFKNRATEDINYGRKSRQAMRALPAALHAKAQTKLARLAAAETMADLSGLPGNRLEHLKGDRKGQCSIRINDQYRICFNWTGNQAEEVEIVDYH